MTNITTNHEIALQMAHKLSRNPSIPRNLAKNLKLLAQTRGMLNAIALAHDVDPLPPRLQRALLVTEYALRRTRYLLSTAKLLQADALHDDLIARHAISPTEWRHLGERVPDSTPTKPVPADTDSILAQLRRALKK